MNHKYDYLFKLLEVGSCGVGKTCLLLKYTDGYFTANHMATFPPDFKIKIINLEKKLIKLQIWDSPGAERFEPIPRSYYKGSHGIIIVYDITDKKSFQKITDFYLKEIKKYCNQDIIKILVGNKCDKAGRVVTEEEGRQLAENYNMSFFEVSAKCSGCVNQIFTQIAKEILNFQLKKKLEELGKNEKLELKKKETKGFFNFFFNKNNKKDEAKEKEKLSLISSVNKNIVGKKDEIKEQEIKIELLMDTIESLENDLKEERNKIRILEDKFNKLNIEFEKDIKALQSELEEEKGKNQILESKVKKYEKDNEEKQKILKESNANINSKESLVNAILEKDREVKELKKRLSRYPFDLNEGEKMMTVNFISFEQKINNYSVICKNTDIFNLIEKQLYEEYKEFYETENYFTVNGRKIHKLKSLDENQIKNNDVIILNTLDI